MKNVTWTIVIGRDEGVDDEDEQFHANELYEFMTKLISLFEHTATMEVRKVEHDDESVK